MKSSDWPGQAIGGTMNSTVRDMARMGELVLQRGRYDGRQLLDEDFVYKLTHPAFEDSNTGYGYLTYLNADENWGYSTGTPDDECSPYTRWPSYPHRPFFEAPDPNGGFPFAEQQHDIGVVWSKGAGGQSFVIHRGLDMVLAVRDDGVSVDESETVGQFEGPKNIWRAIRPALVALDPVYKGDEAGVLRGLPAQRVRARPARAVVPAPAAAAAPPRRRRRGSRPRRRRRASPRAPASTASAVRPVGRGGLRVRVDAARRTCRSRSRLLREARGRPDPAPSASSRRRIVEPRRLQRCSRARPADGFYVAARPHAAAGRRRRPAPGRAAPRAAAASALRPTRACGAPAGSSSCSRSAARCSAAATAGALAVAYRLRRDADAVTVRVLGAGGRAAARPADGRSGPPRAARPARRSAAATCASRSRSAPAATTTTEVVDRPAPVSGAESAAALSSGAAPAPRSRFAAASPVASVAAAPATARTVRPRRSGPGSGGSARRCRRTR